MRTVLTIALAVLTALVLAGPGATQTRPSTPKSSPNPPGQMANPAQGAVGVGAGGAAAAAPDAGGKVPAVAVGTPGNQGPSEVGGKSIDAWIKEIEHPDPSVRERAIRIVPYFGQKAKKAIPVLTREVLRVNDYSPQANAIYALGVIAPLLDPEKDKVQLQSVVTALIRALDNSQAIIRLRASVALGNIGPPARAAVPALGKQIHNTMSWEVRKAICYALGQVGRDELGYPDMHALEKLVDAVDDSISKEVRLEALQALVNLGPPAAADVTRLKRLLEGRLRVDRDKSVVIWVRVAIMRIDPKAITDANLGIIAKQMKGNDLDIRVQAVRALGFIGPLAKSTVPDLMDALQSEEPLLVDQAAWALSRMGTAAERAIPALEMVMNSSKDKAVQESVRQAIEEIKKKK
jgi:hypothetical protein